MTIKKYTKDLYNKFGKEYQKSRENKGSGRLYNENYEMS